MDVCAVFALVTAMTLTVVGQGLPSVAQGPSASTRQAAWESADRGRRAIDRVRKRSDLDEATAREIASEALAEVRTGR